MSGILALCTECLKEMPMKEFLDGRELPEANISLCSECARADESESGICVLCGDLVTSPGDTVCFACQAKIEMSEHIESRMKTSKSKRVYISTPKDGGKDEISKR